MALYEYKCAACGTLTEKRMPMSTVTQTLKCPNCGKMARKTIGNFAVVGLSSASVSDGVPPWEGGGGGDDFGMGGDFGMDDDF